MPPIFTKSNPPTPPNTSFWFKVLRNALAQESPAWLHRCFTTTTSEVFRNEPYKAMSQEIQQMRYESAWKNVVEREMGDEWLGLNEVVVAYFQLLAEAHPKIMAGGYVEETKEYFEKMKGFMKALTSVFNTPRGAVLGFTVKRATKWLVVVAKCIDLMNGDQFFEASESLLELVLRTFNASIAERMRYDKPGMVLKKAVCIDIANYLFRLYTKLSTNRLASSIQGNIANLGLPLRHPYYTHPTLATYHYYRGLLFLRETSFVPAHRHLQQAYDFCHTRFVTHRRKILIPLLMTSILSGRFPRPEVFSAPEATGLDAIFVPLCRAIQKGDFRLFRHAVGIEGGERWREEWFRKQRLHAALPRCNVLLWRGLLRRLWLLQSCHHVIQLDDVHTLAVALHRKSPEDVDWSKMADETEDPGSWWFDGLRVTKEQVEGVVLALLDQRLVKGFLARGEPGQSTRLVVSKTGPFPEIWGLMAGRAPEEVEGEGAGGKGLGGVVKLVGARPAGS